MEGNKWIIETLRQADRIEKKCLPVGRWLRGVNAEEIQDLRKQLEKLVRQVEDKRSSVEGDDNQNELETLQELGQSPPTRSTCLKVIAEYGKAKLNIMEIITEGEETSDAVIKDVAKELKKYPCAIIPYLVVMRSIGSLQFAIDESYELAKETFLGIEKFYDGYVQIGKSSPTPLTISDLLAIIDGDHIEMNEEDKRLRWHDMESVYIDVLLGVSDSCYHTQEKARSAAYCRKALNMQLEHKTYDPTDWAMSAARMSSHFITKEMYPTALNCLASAMKVFEEVGEVQPDNDDRETYSSFLNLLEYWVKYGIAFMDYSWSLMYEKGVFLKALGSSDQYDKPFELDNLDEYIGWMPCHPVTNKKKLKPICRRSLQFILNAKVFYTLENDCAKHIHWTDIHSELYNTRSWYESVYGGRLKMYSTRIYLYREIIEKLDRSKVDLLQHVLYKAGCLIEVLVCHFLPIHEWKLNQEMFESMPRYFEEFKRLFYNSDGQPRRPLKWQDLERLAEADRVLAWYQEVTIAALIIKEFVNAVNMLPFPALTL